MKIFTVEQAAEIDRKTEKDYGISGMVLMENAGKASAAGAEALAGELKTRDIAVICGKGKNGGDGFVCARYLEKAGFNVKTFLVGRKRDVKGSARKALDASAKTIPLSEISSSNISKLKTEISSAGLLVDALLGTGAKGPLKSPVSDVIELISGSGKPALSIDIPSGLDGNTGLAPSASVKAAATVAMGFYKPGLLLNMGPECAGRVTVADIGIPDEILNKTKPEAVIISREDAAGLLPARPENAHKGSMGRVFILGGSIGYSGAAILAAEAAVRSGCGLVYLGAPRTLNPILEARLIEAITKPLPETESVTVGIEAEGAITEIMESADSMALGPGLGQHPETSALIKKIILTSKKPMVIDADAVNSLKGDASILGSRQSPAVLTPHPGELAGLLGKTVGEIMLDPLRILKALAAKYDIIVVMKQARTIIAAPDGSVFVNTTGNPGMATGGSGDVLTGMLASFMARGLEPLEAAKLGVFLHGEAGDDAASRLTRECMKAGDITDSLPRAFKTVGA